MFFLNYQWLRSRGLGGLELDHPGCCIAVRSGHCQRLVGGKVNEATTSRTERRTLEPSITITFLSLHLLVYEPKGML